MKPAINPNKIVVFTGAGISVSSGLEAFRDGGLKAVSQHEQLASPHAWIVRRGEVIDYYNWRRECAGKAQPTPAHLAIARLEQKYEVVVITQNVDDLHERAGSHNVIHLHGELRKVRCCGQHEMISDIGINPQSIGDTCPDGHDMRPHVVWFGEPIMHYEEAGRHFKTAAKVLVIGTSLQVDPAAKLPKKGRYRAEKLIVNPHFDVADRPYSYRIIHEEADRIVPDIVTAWLEGQRWGYGRSRA
ncbi:SIR2 family NAD-dependent protein deacylase [Vreelandella populi]|uniref:SIR2 family NAD-dependent protein deacylase n=1 Tax=Vreelandella populi TaxID=2498858 RepID=UPI000F8D4185|nr:Sir2 family NAD-dependent protein deacetylase [Halomonas populi]RUR36648.1 NAD-dependent deacylase [Halomonas populi]